MEYDDIIGFPHYRSAKRRHMTCYERAAQFSAFAALSGYEEAICETARLTGKREELSDEQIDFLNTQIFLLSDRTAQRPLIKVRYFKADEKKQGGEYLIFEGNLRRIDLYEKNMIFTDGIKIPLIDIIDIDAME